MFLSVKRSRLVNAAKGHAPDDRSITPCDFLHVIPPSFLPGILDRKRLAEFVMSKGKFVELAM
jgi:hypothetical protein